MATRRPQPELMLEATAALRTRSTLDPHTATKFRVPVPRPTLLARPDLVARVEAVHDHKVLLLHAPVGWGKTSLLGAWSQHTTMPIIWVSLDEADGTPLRFWALLADAIARLDPRMARTMEPLVHAARPMPVEQLLPMLVNALARLGEHIAIVLDDYHAITSEAIHANLARLVDYTPSNVHWIISSRTVPPLPVAHWRARGDLLELHTDDLRFDTEETAHLLHARGISPDRAAALVGRTEGWIAALVVLLAHPDAPNESSIHALIQSDVLLREPPDTQRFLTHIAVLDVHDVAACDAVAGRDDSHQLLHALWERDLFITRLSPDTYRLHHLLLDALRARLALLPRRDQAILHQRAAAWYEQAGDLARAIDHHLAVGDMDAAAALIARVAAPMRQRGELATLRRWLDRLPDQALDSTARLRSTRAWARASNGAFAPAEADLHELERTQPASDDLRAEVATIRVRIAALANDFDATVRWGEHALPLLAPDDPDRCDVLFDLAYTYRVRGEVEQAQTMFERAIPLARRIGNLRPALMATSYLADIHVRAGRPHEARRLLEQGVVWTEADPTPAVCWMDYSLGALDLLSNDLATARTRLERALAIAGEAGEIKILAYARVPLARVLAAAGDFDRALSELDAAVPVAQLIGLADVLAAVDMARVRTWLDAERYTEAEAWGRTHGLDTTSNAATITDQQIAGYILLARARNTGDHTALDTAITALRGSVAAHPLPHSPEQIELLVLLALVCDADGRDGEAGRALRQAVAIGEPMALLRPFAEHGATMQRLLHAHAPDAFAARMGAQPVATAPVPAAPPSSTNDLQPREIEVLRHVALGLSNQAIADEMVMALSTIKWYLRNIYSKLDVRSRTQAVAWARAQGIV